MNQKTIDKIKEELTPIDLEDRYRELLDESYPEISIGHATFQPSEIVEKLDPIAFRCGVAEYADSLVTDHQISDEIDGKYYDYREVGKIIEQIQ